MSENMNAEETMREPVMGPAGAAGQEAVQPAAEQAVNGAEAVQSAAEQAVNGAEAVQSAAEQAVNGAEAVQSAAEQAVNGAETVQPTAGFKKKIPGYLEMLAAVVLTGMGAWMYYNTTGTRLLYVDVAFGRICKYYWIALIGAVVFFAVGLYTLKRSRKRKEVKKNGKLE